MRIERQLRAAGGKNCSSKESLKFRLLVVVRNQNDCFTGRRNKALNCRQYRLSPGTNTVKREIKSKVHAVEKAILNRQKFQKSPLDDVHTRNGLKQRRGQHCSAFY